MIAQIARLTAGLFVFISSLVIAAQAVPARQPVTMERACELLSARVRSFSPVECQQSGLKPSGFTSVRGQPILTRDYPAPATSPHKPYRVLLMGGIHGDEMSSVGIVYDWMRRLDAENARQFDWRVIFCLNPDGMLARRPTRMNAHGVDLNRNFPTLDWESDALRYWRVKARKDPRRYPGRQALSEPETRALLAIIKDYHPDVIVSVHAPYGVLDFDGPQKPPKRFGYLYLQLLGTYPGSLGNYAGMNLSVPVITLELPNAIQTPTSAQAQRIWADMLAWLDKNLKKRETAQNGAPENQLTARATP